MQPSPLESWYLSQCNGDWEHSYGVTIETLDNPGWKMKIDLRDTPAEFQQLERRAIQRADQNDWIQCWTKDKAFHIACGPLNLTEAVQIFIDWFTSKPA